MEFKNIVYWNYPSETQKTISSLFYKDCNSCLDKLGNLLGCDFDKCNRMINVLRDNDIETKKVLWIARIVDRKKYLLAKIRYGI